jgi:hypothetical protein
MECGVINEMLKASVPSESASCNRALQRQLCVANLQLPITIAPQGPLGDVLDTQQLISDVSGAGNNWAHGNHAYGPQYHDMVRPGVLLA